MAINQIKPVFGYLGDPPMRPKKELELVGEKVSKIYSTVVFKFSISDVDDFEIYAAEPIWNWQQTEVGKWVMSHAVESPVWHRHLDPYSFYHNFAIVAKFYERDYTYWCLKYADTIDK